MMPKHSFRAPWARRLTALLAVSLFTVSACSDDGGGVAGGSNVTEVEIVTIPNLQALTNLVPGTTRQMLGVPTNSAGNWVDKPVTWASSNTAVATVDAAGLVTTLLGGGSTYIRATAGGKTDSILVAVRFPVGSIAIAPAVVNLNREGSQALTLTVLDTQGAAVTGRTIAFTTSDAAVATVSSAGVVQASASTADGTTATITATAANASDGGTVVAATRLVTVSGDPVVNSVLLTGGSGLRPNTGTLQLTASPRSGLNNVVPGVTIDWTTSAAGIATVDATGLVTFNGPLGAVTITATATGAGSGGSSPASASDFEVLTPIVTGAATAIAIPASTGAEFVLDGTGFTSFTLATSGGTGDVDLLTVPNGTTGYGISNTLFTTGSAGSTGCLSGAAGNGESCARAFGAQSFWRIIFWAFGGTAVATTYTVTLTP